MEQCSLFVAVKIVKIWALRIITVIVVKMEVRLDTAVMQPNAADETANSADPDQTAPKGSRLFWVCTVCQDLSQCIEFLKLFRAPDKKK